MALHELGPTVVAQINPSSRKRARLLIFQESLFDLRQRRHHHIPFLKAGVPAVDLIDLDYPAWHTAQDTLDNVAARSLQIVGDVVVAALPEIEQRLLKN